jgi:hypothetical protein
MLVPSLVSSSSLLLPDVGAAGAVVVANDDVAPVGRQTASLSSLPS